MKTEDWKNILKEYAVLTLATIILVVGIYFFKFPNNFSFGGVSGLAVVLTKAVPFSASAINFVINMALLVLGFVFLGKKFGIKTVYVSILSSVGISVMEALVPLKAPLTDQPVLELIFAIVLPAFSAAILFNMEASGGGTDIIAMIIKKYSTINTSRALLFVDLIIVMVAWFAFDLQTGLFSLCGLMAKSLVIDKVIADMNLSKYLTIICEDPEPICEYIHKELCRSSTVFKGEGSFTHENRTIVMTAMNRKQAVKLRRFIQSREQHAFIMITNSSETVGKGFHFFD